MIFFFLFQLFILDNSELRKTISVKFQGIKKLMKALMKSFFWLDLTLFNFG